MLGGPRWCYHYPDRLRFGPVDRAGYGLPRKPAYMADEYDKRTVSVATDQQGYVSNLKYFAERGEFDSATDEHGNVYIADGDVYVYDSSGKQIKMIKVPERPTSIVISGKMLYITGHNALYEARIN